MTTPASTSQQLQRQFQQWLTNDGKSPATIQSYTTDIKDFITYLTTKTETFTGQLIRLHITSFIKHLTQKELQPNTINKKINSLQSFNNFLIQHHHTQETVINQRQDKIKTARGSEHIVTIFTETETEKILFLIQDQNKVTIRNKLIIHLLIYTGIRASEIINIKLKDIDLLTMNLTISCGKGNKQRTIPLKNEVIQAIQHYLTTERKTNKHASSPYLLIS